MLGDRGDGVTRSFAPSSTAPNPRLEVNRMKSRIKYSPLCIPGIPKGGCKKAREGRKRRRTGAGSVRDEARQGSLYLITNSKSPAGERGSFHPSTPLLRHHPRSLSPITPLPLSRSERHHQFFTDFHANDHRSTTKDVRPFYPAIFFFLLLLLLLL